MAEGSQFPDLGKFFGEVGSPGQMLPTNEAAKACPFLEKTQSFCTLDEELCPFVGFSYRKCKKYITQMAKGRSLTGINSIYQNKMANSPMKNVGQVIGEWLSESRSLRGDLGRARGSSEESQPASEEDMEELARERDALMGEIDAAHAEIQSIIAASGEDIRVADLATDEFVDFNTEQIDSLEAELEAEDQDPNPLIQNQAVVDLEKLYSLRKARADVIKVNKLEKQLAGVRASIADLQAAAKKLVGVGGPGATDAAGDHHQQATGGATTNIARTGIDTEQQSQDDEYVANADAPGNPSAYTVADLNSQNNQETEVNGPQGAEVGGAPKVTPPDAKWWEKPIPPEWKRKASGRVEKPSLSRERTKNSPLKWTAFEKGTDELRRGRRKIPRKLNPLIAAAQEKQGETPATPKFKVKNPTKPRPKAAAPNTPDSDTTQIPKKPGRDSRHSITHEQFMTGFKHKWDRLTPDEQKQFFAGDGKINSVDELDAYVKELSGINTTDTIQGYRKTLDGNFDRVRKYNSEKKQQIDDYHKDLEQAKKLGLVSPSALKDLKRRAGSDKARGLMADSLNKARDGLIAYDIKTTKVGNFESIRVLQQSLLPTFDKKSYEVMRMSEQAGLRAIQMQHQYGRGFGKFNTWNLFAKQVVLPVVLGTLGLKATIPAFMSYWPDAAIQSFYMSFLNKTLPKYKGRKSLEPTKDSKFWASQKMVNPTTHDKIMRGFDDDMPLPADRAVMHTRSVPTTKVPWSKSRNTVLAKRFQDSKVTRTSDDTDWRSGFSRTAVRTRKAHRRH